jgi:hypothetical protein
LPLKNLLQMNLKKKRSSQLLGTLFSLLLIIIFFSFNWNFPNQPEVLHFKYQFGQEDTATAIITYSLEAQNNTKVNIDVSRQGEVYPFHYSFQYRLNNNSNGVLAPIISIFPFSKLGLTQEASISAITAGDITYPKNIKNGQVFFVKKAFEYKIDLGSNDNAYITYVGTVTNCSVTNQTTASFKNNDFTCYEIKYSLDIYSSLNNHPFEQHNSEIVEWYIPELGVVSRKHQMKTQLLGFIPTDASQKSQNQQTESFHLKGLSIN